MCAFNISNACSGVWCLIIWYPQLKFPTHDFSAWHCSTLERKYNNFLSFSYNYSLSFINEYTYIIIIIIFENILLSLCKKILVQWKIRVREKMSRTRTIWLTQGLLQCKTTTWLACIQTLKPLTQDSSVVHIIAEFFLQP